MMAKKIQKEVLELYLQERAKEKPSVFAQLYRTLKGHKFRYISKTDPHFHRPFFIQIIDDMSQDKVIKKARQIGASESHVNEVLWFLCNHQFVNAIYTFPRDKQLIPFSKTRVDPAIDGSEYISSFCPPNIRVRNVYQKAFLPTSSNLFMVSAWESGLGEGMSADMLCFDEYDRMQDDVETAFSEAISASKYKLLRRFSTPTTPNRGVAKLYNISTQHRYFHKCDHCGEWQYLTFEDNLVLVNPQGVNEALQTIEDGSYKIVCKKCKKELNRMGMGKWIASYENRDIVGYHISQLDCPWISADEIMRKRFKYTSDQLFYNYVLGLEYQSTGLLLTEDDFYKAVNPNIGPTFARGECVMVTAGIDWGRTNWVVVLGLLPSGRVRLLNLFMVEDTNIPLEQVRLIASKLSLYQPEVIVCDSGYGQDRNSELLNFFPGRVYSCMYVDKGFLANWNPSKFTVRANRTMSIMQLIGAIKRGMIEFWKIDNNLKPLIQHFLNLAILNEEEETGEITETVVNNGPDHLVHAFNYAYLAIDRERIHNIKHGSFDFTFVEEPAHGKSPYIPAPFTIPTLEEFDRWFWERVKEDEYHLF
jgi:hypothetical protein